MLEALSKPFDRTMSHPAALERDKYALTPLQVSLLEYKVRVEVNLKPNPLLSAFEAQPGQQPMHPVWQNSCSD